MSFSMPDRSTWSITDFTHCNVAYVTLITCQPLYYLLVNIK